MQSRPFGRTGRNVGEIGFGASAIGAGWGEVDDNDAVAAGVDPVNPKVRQ